MKLRRIFVCIYRYALSAEEMVEQDLCMMEKMDFIFQSKAKSEV